MDLYSPILITGDWTAGRLVDAIPMLLFSEISQVENFGHCPVSGQPMMIEEIRRLRDEA